MFCLGKEAECRDRRFRGAIRLTEERWTELRAINRAINLAIVPTPTELALQARSGSSAPIAAIAMTTQ
nr:transglutaminase-like cysteine peptidase [Bradyrhizobium canariense]